MDLVRRPPQRRIWAHGWQCFDREASLAADLGSGAGTTRITADGFDLSWMSLRLGSSFFLDFFNGGGQLVRLGNK